MALHSIPLLAPEGPPSLLDRVEAYLLESQNAADREHDEPDVVFRGVNVLVSLSASEDERRALWSLRYALAFGQTTHWNGADWPDRLAKRVAAVEPQFATAVIYVGSDAVLAAETVQSAIDTVQRQLGAALAAVLVVAARTEPLASLHGVTGFVCGVRSTNGDTARQVFLAFTSFMAPEALGGIDLLDLLPGLGSASAPTVLAEGLWFREAGRLMYPTIADKHAVASAMRVLAVPFVRDWGWDELRRFQRALRDAAPESASSIVFATNNALMSGLLPSNVGFVPIICASSALLNQREQPS